MGEGGGYCKSRPFSGASGHFLLYFIHPWVYRGRVQQNRGASKKLFQVNIIRNVFPFHPFRPYPSLQGRWGTVFHPPPFRLSPGYCRNAAHGMVIFQNPGHIGKDEFGSQYRI